MKAGAAPVEPVNGLDAKGLYRLNVDPGDQRQPGRNALVLGNVANSRDCAEPEVFEAKRLRSRGAGLPVRADASGGPRLFFGTHSGYEGTTSLYYTRFTATFRRQPAGPRPEVPGWR